MRCGASSAEIPVVITSVALLIALLVSLVVPTRATIRQKSRKQETAGNLKRIFEAQIGYSTDHGTFAHPRGVPQTPVQDVAHVGRAYLCLARAMELDSRLFAARGCPARPTEGFHPGELSLAQVLGEEPGMDPVEPYRWAAAYAYDYTFPANSTNWPTGRPVIGDRDPSIRKGKKAVVAYADGHTSFLDAEPAPDGVETLVVVGDVPLRLERGRYRCPSAENGEVDDIYSFDVHLGEPPEHRRTPGGGSSTLGWLR